MTELIEGLVVLAFIFLTVITVYCIKAGFDSFRGE